MDEILQEFLTESSENLDHVERDLVALEESPDSRQLMAAIFRNIHTIKGSSGFLGLSKLESVAHAGENLLSSLRDGKLALNAEITTVLLTLVDALRRMLQHLEAKGAETDEDFSALVAELKRLNNPDAAPADAAPAEKAPAAEKTEAPAKGETASATEEKGAPAASAPEKKPETSTAKPAAQPEATKSAPARQGRESAPQEPPPPPSLTTETNVRVSVGLLDKLMNLVGELVLARNQILQITGGVDDTQMVAASQRLNHVTTELQEEVMKTRLQPIGNVFTKFPRVVRDVARELGKKVRLELEGKDTELDRTILEAIKDPLTHIVRNAVDHGIELPEVRRESGKNEEGHLLMKAFHEGGQVIIEISDDGKGINAEKVKQKAIDNGLITADQAARMADRDAFQLIFHPGLSTAEKVTNISGRGVGMDVVKTNIEKIGGTVEINSELGKGTTLRIKIPLTLAIIPAIMVESGSQRFAIPQVNLQELVRLDGEEVKTSIETILGTPVYRLRGRLLPLVRLSEVLDLPERDDDQSLNIVVVQAENRHFGLVVDRVFDTQEIVVKPLGDHLKSVAAFAGATIMGDGRVALILDVIGIAEKARISSKIADVAAEDAVETRAAVSGDRRRLLVFGMGDSNRAAIDLSTVGRLEKLPRSMVEHAGNREVVQYRDDVMDLLRLEDVLGYPPTHDDDELLHVVVYTVNGKNLGLVVGRILDIVEEEVRIQGGQRGNGIIGRAVIQGRVTEMLDVDGIVRQFDPEFAGHN